MAIYAFVWVPFAEDIKKGIGDWPQPQGALFKSNINNPVVYIFWLVILTLFDFSYKWNMRRVESYLERFTPIGKEVKSSAFIMTVPSSWTDINPLSCANDLLTKLHGRRIIHGWENQWGKIVTWLTGRFHCQIQINHTNVEQLLSSINWYHD